MACQHLYWTERDSLCCAAKLPRYMSAAATYATSHIHHLHACMLLNVQVVVRILWLRSLCDQDVRLSCICLQQEWHKQARKQHKFAATPCKQASDAAGTLARALVADVAPAHDSTSSIMSICAS